MARQRKNQSEKLKSLKSVINQINKKEGENIIGFSSDPEIEELLKIEFLPVKSLALRNAIKGLPRGKMSLIVGNPDSGKTSFLLETIAYNQQLDPELIAGWLETEGSMNDEMLDMFGIDRKRFIYYEIDPDNGAAEKALDYARALCEAGVDMLCINSLKSLTPQKEMSDTFEDQNVAISARLNARAMRVLIPIIANSGTALAIVQHKSTDIGSYGGGTTITGGRAIVYNSVLTLDFNKVSIKSGDPYYDRKDDFARIRVRCTKNHVTTKQPYTVTDYTVKYGMGTDLEGEYIQAAFDFGIIHKEGGGYIREYPIGVEPGDKKNVRVLEDGTKCEWRGMNNFSIYLQENPDYYNYLKQKIEQLDLSSSVQSMSEEEIAILEQANKANMSEEEYMAQLDEIIDNPEE